MLQEQKQKRDQFKIGGALVAMGVVYGDIGTSPLYVMKAIIEMEACQKFLRTLLLVQFL